MVDPLAETLPSLNALHPAGSFAGRHIGPRPDETAEMLAVDRPPDSLEELVDACVPEGVRDRTPLDLPAADDEAAVLALLRERAAANDVYTSMIGLGYYGTVTPAVIQRNVLENPAWYTAYTPYQPEISQGRLEALINFQTMVADLTGLDVAGASMLDEATAAAEAMTLVRRAGRAKSDAVFVVDADTLPQTLAVLETRAEPLGIRLHVTDLSGGWPTDLPEAGAFGVLLSYPGASGAVRDHRALAEAAHDAGAVGRRRRRPARPHAARGAGGVGRRRRLRHHPALRRPHGLRRAARRLPLGPRGPGPPAARPAGRRLGGRRRRRRLPARPADPRAAHPPREGDQQHLHRPGAARRHGRRVRGLPRPRGPGRDRRPRAPQRLALAGWLRAGGLELVHEHFFDTLTVAVPGRAAEVVAAAAERRINLRLVDADTVAVACDETTTVETLRAVAHAFGVAVRRRGSGRRRRRRAARTACAGRRRT